MVDVADSELKTQITNQRRKADAIQTVYKLAQTTSSKTALIVAIERNLSDSLALTKDSKSASAAISSLLKRRYSNKSKPPTGPIQLPKIPVTSDKEMLMVSILDALIAFAPISSRSFPLVKNEISSSSNEVVSRTLKFFSTCVNENQEAIVSLLTPLLMSSSVFPAKEEDEKVAIEFYRVCSEVLARRSANQSASNIQQDPFFIELVSAIRDERVNVFLHICLFLAKVPWKAIESMEVPNIVQSKNASASPVLNSKLVPELVFRFAQHFSINNAITQSNVELACTALGELGKSRILHFQSLSSSEANDEQLRKQKNPLLSVMTCILPWNEHFDSNAMRLGISKMLIWTALEPSNGDANDGVNAANSDFYLLSRLKSINIQPESKVHLLIIETFLERAEISPAFIPALLEYTMHRLCKDGEACNADASIKVWSFCLGHELSDDNIKNYVLRSVLSTLDLASSNRFGIYSSDWMVKLYRFIGVNAKVFEISGQIVKNVQSKSTRSNKLSKIENQNIRCLITRLVFGLHSSPLVARLECVKSLMIFSNLFQEPVKEAVVDCFQNLSSNNYNYAQELGILGLVRDCLLELVPEI